MATDTLRELDLNIAECLENCPELDVSYIVIQDVCVTFTCSFVSLVCLQEVYISFVSN